MLQWQSNDMQEKLLWINRPCTWSTSKYMKILLGDFNVKIQRKYIFKLRNGNERLYETNNSNGVRAAHSATSRHLIARAQY